MYTEEVFVHIRINKILRDHDIPLILKLKYYYFYLLHSLKTCRSIIHKKILFRGMKLNNQESMNLYDR